MVSKINKSTLQRMVNLLDRFEQLQSNITDLEWNTLCDFLNERDSITWIEISNFRDALKDYLLIGKES